MLRPHAPVYQVSPDRERERARARLCREMGIEGEERDRERARAREGGREGGKERERMHIARRHYMTYNINGEEAHTRMRLTLFLVFNIHMTL